ncbi:hypothetical protein D041_0267B, partial [Vibrio parahaemolyticus EKP-008]
LSKTSKS